ncbi:hypothetical protein HPB49_008055 [Dermacentor silvarum]|uniref:Uncharacterized protein n=1 Tax=Dermacentor silvarum TaxID=543639 RepID=A0ACB8DIW6_DERSI|nr:hypothetical protein HPB49_008055 [Dermacentor silvarum]
MVCSCSCITSEARQGRGIAAARVGPPLPELPSTVDEPLGGDRPRSDAADVVLFLFPVNGTYPLYGALVIEMILDSQYRRADSSGTSELSQEESLYCRTQSVQLKDDFCAGARRLKTQQGLLVDFLAFPQKFVDLLELCTKDELKDSPRFVLSLTVHGRIGSDPAILDVIEANPFKHLVHLSLKLAPAPDTVVRKHLTSAMRLLKDENRRLEAAFRSSETDLHSRLQQYQEMATERSRELDRVRSLHASQLASLREQHERELAAEKENVRKATSEQQFRLDLEHRETEQRLKKQIQVLEADVSIKETLNKDLQEKLAKSEQVCRELSLKVTALESAVGQCQRTAEVLSRSLTPLPTRFRAWAGGDKPMQRQAEALLEQRQAQLSRREAAVKTLSDDILKGNEIIKRLQGELRTYHAKLRLRSEVITKQEDVLTEKEQQVQRLVRRVDDLELASKNKEAEVEKARQRVEEVEQKLAECQKQVKTNENVIQWLNKQLNSCQLQQDKRGSPAGLSSSKQSTFPNMTPGVRQESPVLLKPIDDSPLVDPRFLQPQAADPTTQRALNPLDTATTPFGTAAIGRQRAPAATQAPPYYPTTAKTKPS